MIRSAERDFQRLAGLPDDQFFADPFVASGNPDAAGNETTGRMRAGEGSYMTICRKLLLMGLAGARAPCGWTARADAADAPPDYPNHTVRIIVPFPAGG